MVPRIQLNLSAPGVTPLLLIQWGLLLLTAGALTLTGTFWWIGTNLHEQIDGLDERLAALTVANDQFVSQAQRENIDLSNTALSGLPKRIAFVKQLRERVGFSWTQLLTDLESAVPSRVSMDAVSLEDKTNTIQLQGSAKTLEDLNRLLHQLENHPAFKNVILEQHATKSKKEELGESYVLFSMKAEYQHQL